MVNKNECKEFAELRKSNIVDERVGCIALKTRGGDGCIENVGATLRYCPYCGAKIESNFMQAVGGGNWEWWHS